MAKPKPLIAAAIAAALAGSRSVLGAETGDSPVLQEVVVTANRREENVLTIPYNISAISSQQIEAAGVKDLVSLTRMVPGLVSADLGPRSNSTNSNLIIRGLNASDQGSNVFGPNLAVPLVSTYIDDVPLFVNFNLTDIERVEVLRGPQGTLYGSGAVGGTVKLIRHKPQLGVLSADVTADTSGTDHSSGASYSFDGIFNAPLGESVALRVNAGYTKLTGFINGVHSSGFQQNSQPLLAINAGVGLQATKQLKVRLYCNNLSNQLGITTWAVAHQPEQSTEYLMRPRTAGINLEYSFTR